MKALIVSIALLLCVPAAGQHPLIGTWEMISVKGIDADGESFFLDTTAVRETKIITPTHYMLIAWDVDGDSLIFNRTMAGQVRLQGEKYIEIPTQASVQIFENVKVDFTWKLENDVFTQSGTIVRPDGKTVVLEALKFRRVRNIRPQQKNPAIGTWNQLSAHYLSADGTSTPVFEDGDQRLLIVTPTHWMRMDHNDKAFVGALYGTYTMKGDTVFAKPIFSSYPLEIQGTIKALQQVNGSRIQFTSTGLTPRGDQATMIDVLEKVD